ncbi:Anhydro-N-acetylmuramic acid kinase [hydrothermal vent metagenome]|uniref:Anhydro-N-acetylmuramic acid kinase n=1 Tax=hydrothermal vent metagenome TaxID=652676 RepID=A0A3B0U3X2_9ZZZZ
MTGYFSNKHLTHRVVGVMSGTSLDGLDLAACTFTENNGSWGFEINKAQTIGYPRVWGDRLAGAAGLSAEGLIKLHNDYGVYIGRAVKAFVSEAGFKAVLVASHGHTVFHQPERGFTFQVGNGACIAAECGITTVSDFRISDVALGGQGAPLVPVGDRELFKEYGYCLNLGGFANISFEKNCRRAAFDICPVNLALNHYAQKLGEPFDKNGAAGQTGTINKKLLEQLNKIEFYTTAPPKSLGREWVETIFFKVLEESDETITNVLRTLYEHIAFQIAKVIGPGGEVLVTGGGAHNQFLTGRLMEHCRAGIIIPGTTIVDFKEALIFAFLGLLRSQDKINCLSSVTGAREDSSGGTIYLV